MQWKTSVTRVKGKPAKDKQFGVNICYAGVFVIQPMKCFGNFSYPSSVMLNIFFL